MSPEIFFGKLSVWGTGMILCLKFYTFCLYFILYLHVWIRIRNKNPDPQSSWIRIQYGSGSTGAYAGGGNRGPVGAGGGGGGGGGGVYNGMRTFYLWFQLLKKSFIKGLFQSTYLFQNLNLGTDSIYKRFGKILELDPNYRNFISVLQHWFPIHGTLPVPDTSFHNFF